MSGAGNIKHDGHDDDYLYEIKTTTKKQYTLREDDLATLWRRSVQQNKKGLLIIEFTDFRAVVIIEKKPQVQQTLFDRLDVEEFDE